MKKYLTVLVMAVGLAGQLCAADTLTDKPKINRAMIRNVERNFDESFTHIWSDDPFSLLGTTRGIYLDAYGIVLSAEVNVAPGPPLSPMLSSKVNPLQIADHKKRKTQRMPQLRDAMLKMLVSSAAMLDTLPGDEQIVLGVTLSKYSWEDPNAFPSQVVMQASRKKLLELSNANPDQIRAAIRIQEY